ncbi:hypothetical protein AWENTII_006027 [Aspergillus wentii]
MTALGPGELSTVTGDALAKGDASEIIFIGKSGVDSQHIINEMSHRYPRVNIIFIQADFTELASVRHAAQVIKELDAPIGGIIGFPALVAAPWELTSDGIESQFQVNYLSHFLLVNLLSESMADDARVVMVSSSIRPEASAPKFDDINFSVSAALGLLEAG